MPSARQGLQQWLLRALDDASSEDREGLAESLEKVFDDDRSLPELKTGELDRLAAAGGRPPPAAAGGGLGRSFPDREMRQIEICDFKGIERMTLEFARHEDRRRDLPCMMLLGENSAGKSSILEAIALALAGTSAAGRVGIIRSAYLRRDDPDGFDIVDPSPPKVVVTFRDEDEPAVFAVTRDGREFEGSSKPSVLVLAYGARRHFSDRIRPPREPAGLIRNLFKPDQPLPSAGPWLRRISEDPETFNAVARALREILALDDDDQIELDASERLVVKTLGRRTPVENLSEGYRSLFSLAVDIMRNLLGSWPDLERARAVVLIDEIETHLHPRWKMRIVSALRSAFPGVQFVISTHDPLCLRGMDNGEVEVFERDADGRMHKLGDLPHVRGMSAEQLLTSEYFGLYSTADAGLEWELARAVQDGATDARRAKDDELIESVVLGDTIKQQLIHEALDGYLRKREQRRGQVVARREAVEAVIKVLESDADGTPT